MIDPTQRFSSRVENYIKFRPGYPQAVIEILENECGLTKASLVTDIGSGTGILTKLFLENGNTVLAVEPNQEMRLAGEDHLGKYSGFRSINGTAESTTLAAHSVDFVTAGQAFHWFDRAKAKIEFQRILKPGGWIILIWNERRTMSTPFLRAYEQLLRRTSVDYEQVDQRKIDQDVLKSFYGAEGYHSRSLPHQQVFDYTALKGRLLSSSYTPEEGHPNHPVMLDELASIFQTHQINGQVEFEYLTKLYYGRLDH